MSLNSRIPNLECIMCYGNFSSSIRKNREKLPSTPTVYDEKFLESLDPIIPDLKYVKFLGGEPFLINIYYEVWERIIECNPNCLIDVQTNGTILNDRVKDILERGNFRIGVSLDSLKKETYERYVCMLTLKKFWQILVTSMIMLIGRVIH